MNRAQAERAVSEAADLTTAETVVMLTLLRRAHNDTCEVPDWRTPSIEQLAREAKVTRRWAQLLLAHLEKHQWLKRVPGNGRGHKTAYRLLPGGTPLPCDCPKGRSGVHPLEAERAYSTSPERAYSESASPQVTPDIAPRDVQGKGFTKGGAPDWRLISQITRIVHNAPGGGLHREELAEKVGLPHDGPSMREALGIAYRRKQIDFCRQYVVKPVPQQSNTRNSTEEK